MNWGIILGGMKDRLPMSASSEERRRSDLTGSMASFEILGMIRGIVYVDSHDLVPAYSPGTVSNTLRCWA